MTIEKAEKDGGALISFTASDIFQLFNLIVGASFSKEDVVRYSQTLREFHTLIDYLAQGLHKERGD